MKVLVSFYPNQNKTIKANWKQIFLLNASTILKGDKNVIAKCALGRLLMIRYYLIIKMACFIIKGPKAYLV